MTGTFQTSPGFWDPGDFGSRVSIEEKDHPFEPEKSDGRPKRGGPGLRKEVWILLKMEIFQPATLGNTRYLPYVLVLKSCVFFVSKNG